MLITYPIYSEVVRQLREIEKEINVNRRQR